MIKQISVGEIITLAPGHTRVDILDGVVPLHADHPPPLGDTAADLGNVVPFARSRGPARRGQTIELRAEASRPRIANPPGERPRMAAFATASLALHAGLFTALLRGPAPLASIGMEVMSVEITIGATAPAGVAPT